MENKIKKELTEIILELKDVSDKLGMEISQETIFKEASSFLRGKYAGRNKFKESEENKPTQKQIDFLNKNKIEIPETKQEAFILIQERINKLKGGKK